MTLIAINDPTALAVARPAPPATLEQPAPTLTSTRLHGLLTASPARLVADRLRLGEPGGSVEDVRASVEANLAELEAYVEEARRLVDPAKPEAILAEYARLAAHYPPPGRSTAADEAVAEDWADLLAEFPIDLIALACRQWKLSTERFAPTPGMIKPPLDRAMGARRILLRRAEAVLAEVRQPGTLPKPLQHDPNLQPLKRKA